MISPSPITFTKRMEENKIVSSSAPTTLTYPEPGWVSMDVDEYLALTIKGMKECASQMKEKGLDVTKIKSIMGDGVICGICGVDKDGNAITPYINYLDSRTKEDVELVNSWELEIFGKETGNPEANCMFPAIPEEMMPRIVKPWDIIGHLTEEIAQETGLPAGIPICGGAGDTMQSMIGSGNMEPGQAVDVAGTCSMFCVSTKGIIPELSKKGAGLVFNSGSLPDTYFYWGYIRTGGLALRWFKDNICKKAEDGSYYQVLEKDARKVPAGSNGVLFLPYLTGGINDIPDAVGCFLNMTMDTDQATLWHAVLEAIGYDYMEITDLYRSAGIDLSRITITEGGSRDNMWNQMKADMLDSRTVTLENAAGAVMTNCMFGAYAVGDVDNIAEALTGIIHLKNEFEPNEENVTFYRGQYEKKTHLVKDTMKEAFSILAELR